MTGWLEIDRAKLTTRAYEITFSLIDLKDLWREARKRKRSHKLFGDQPFHDRAPPQR